MDLKRIGQRVSGIVLVASLLVHLGTFVPAIGLSVDTTWPSPPGGHGELRHLVHRARSFEVRRRAESRSWNRRERLEAQRALRGRVIAATPPAVRVAVVLTCMYAAYNFLAFMSELPGTPREAHGGGYELHSHGTVIRAITSTEYARFRALEVRGFSGHWLIFSLVPFVFFTWPWPRLQSTE
jgi:hypothetical protein